MLKLDTPILAILPTAKHDSSWMTTPDIAERLRQQGYDIVHLKTVLRRLRVLEDSRLVIGRRQGRVFQWQRRQGATGLVKGAMSFDEALALQILHRFATRQLPEQVGHYLAGLFDAAEARLKHPHDASERRYVAWSRKVAVIGNTFQLERPGIRPEVFQRVSDALFMERLLRIEYRPGNRDKKPYVLQPLGLVETADGLLYLVARTQYKDTFIPEPGRYRLDRMASAYLHEENFAYPSDFQLSAYIQEQRKMEFYADQKVTVMLKVTQALGARLLETPLAQDHTVTPCKNGGMTVRTNVVLSLRFREWLMAQGSQLEVLAPATLRDELAAEVEAMHVIYTMSKKK